MALFRLLYHHKVINGDIPKLDASVRRRVKSAIERKLPVHPEQFAKPLAYTRAGLWSLRVGSWRVVFALREEEVLILKIGHRRERFALRRRIQRASVGDVAPARVRGYHPRQRRSSKAALAAARPSQGKRGGLRVIYHWHTSDDSIYMLLIYSKAQKQDLTRRQLRILRQLVKENL
ncbi:MAG: type II toxin-antitoxin system RelE/ParE family toxin [Acidobacteriota bacterium]